MNGPIRRVALGLFVAFLLLTMDVTYWQLLAGDRLRLHPDNPRAAGAGSRQQRGQIISSDAAVLAASIPDPSDPRSYVRDYPFGPLYAHSVGFSSRLVGDSGVEASHASLLALREDLALSSIMDRLLGQEPALHSVQLTIDHRLQQMAQRALGTRRGAVLAIEPASGRLLAVVSSPTFDPNSLIGPRAGDAWEDLLKDGGALVNRVTGDLIPGELLPEEVLETPLPEAPALPTAALPIALRAMAVAGAGFLMKPYIVARVFDVESNIESEAEPAPLTSRIGFEEALSIRDGMESLVIHTEAFGRLPGLGEAGSGYTGTGGRVTWFAGFSPVRRPAIVVAVVVESIGPLAEEGAGGAEVASIGRVIMREWLDRRVTA